ncbi:MAG: NAD(+) synthase [Candidatus Woesearchaeota archaeon]|nr:NAD(+) synthase [Candidatus Woesearchaeota archaeon]
MLEHKIMMATMYPAVVAREIEDAILRDVLQSDANGAVLGLSGGVDSTCVALITKSAFDRYNRRYPDKKQLQVYGVILPASSNDPADQKDAERVAKFLGIEYGVIPIQPIIDSYVAQMPDALANRYDRGNLASEVRATIISRESAFRKSIMLNTGNKDEDQGIGYCTKRGDNLGDLAPIAQLPKRLVRDLARFYHADDDLVKRKPTAGLWPGQSDEGELKYASMHVGWRRFSNLGTYDYVEIVTNGLDQGLSAGEIDGETGISRNVIEDIKFRHDVVAPHKNQVAPPSIPVTLKYAPLDWRMYEDGKR